MTGQILAGANPLDASRYQLAVMFLLTASTTMATMAAVIWTVFTVVDAKVRMPIMNTSACL